MASSWIRRHPPRGRLVGLERWQFLGLQAGGLGEMLAQTVQPQHARLQLAETDRHRVEMALDDFLRLDRFLALVGEKERLKEGILRRRRVFQRDEIEDQRAADHHGHQPERAQHPVPPVEREHAGTRRGARQQNDVQLASSQRPAGMIPGRPAHSCRVRRSPLKPLSPPTRRSPRGKRAAVRRRRSPDS